MKEKLIEILRKAEWDDKLHWLDLYDLVDSADSFADYLLANGVIVLPCKVGDTVYIVKNNTDACRKCEYYSAFYGGIDPICAKADDIDERCYPEVAEKPICEKQYMEVFGYRPKEDWIFNHRNDFGKTVFLTREEAEAALKEGQG